MKTSKIMTDQFPNPYSGFTVGENGVRVSITVSKEHHHKFKMARLEQGTITTLMCQLFMKAHDLFEQEGLFKKNKILTPVEVEKAINSIKLSL